MLVSRLQDRTRWGAPGEVVFLVWNEHLVTHSPDRKSTKRPWISEYKLSTNLKILKFNSLPLKIGNPKRKLIFQPSFFRGYVKFRGCTPPPKKINMVSPKKGHFKRDFHLATYQSFQGHIFSFHRSKTCKYLQLYPCFELMCFHG